MLKNNLKMSLGISSLTGVIVGLALTFGNPSLSDNEMWRKIGQTIHPVPSSLSLAVSTLTQGGGVTATSTSGTAVPLLASDFDTENVIDVTCNVSSCTLSFPATTTLTSFVPNAGNTRTLFVRNATTTADISLTISGGTGVLAKFASTTPDTTGEITGDTDGGNYAKIELVRKSNTDIEALVSLFKD